MMKLFTQMFRYPLTVFVATMEAFANAVREIQKTTDQTIEAMAGGVAQAVSNSPDSHQTGGVIADDANKATLKEESKMSDQDLGGTDLKYIGFSIVFTKGDLEATLEQQEEDLVNYSTDGASYGAIQIARFFGRVERNEITRPAVWRENSYPPDAIDDTHWELPAEDRRYVSFIYSVDRRLDKNDPNYPRDQVKVLRQIRDRL